MLRKSVKIYGLERVERDLYLWTVRVGSQQKSRFALGISLFGTSLRGNMFLL